MKKIFSLILASVLLMGAAVTVNAETTYLFEIGYNYEQLLGKLDSSQMGTYLKAYGTSDGSYDAAEFFIEEDTDKNKYLKMKGSAFIQQATGFSPKITDDIGVFEMMAKVDSNTPKYQLRLNFTSTFADGYGFDVNIPEKYRGIEPTDDWIRVKIIFTSEGKYMIILNDEIITPMSAEPIQNITKLFNTNLSYYRIINSYKTGEKGRSVLIKNIYVYGLPQSDVVSSVPAEGDDWAETDGKIELSFSGNINNETLKNIKLSSSEGEDIEIDAGEVNENKLLIESKEELLENTEYVLDLSGVSDIYGLGLKTKKITFTTKLVNPEPVSVEVKGKTRVQIKDDVKENYSVEILNVRGTTQGIEQKAQWSLGGEYKGVSIDDGVLTVTSEASAGEIEIIATAGAVSGKITVYLDDVDASGLIETVDMAEKLMAEISEFDEEKYNDLQIKTAAGKELVDKEIRTQNEVDAAKLEIEEAAKELIISMYALPEAENAVLEGEAVEGIGYAVKADVKANENVTLKDCIYNWYVGEGESYEKVQEVSHRYGFNESDYAKTVYAEVIPQYEYFGFLIEGQPVKTEIKNAPSRPEVSDVKITGTVKVGETLGVTYRFYHREGFIDSGSLIEWKDASNDIVLGKGDNYKITLKDAGRLIKVTVTPVTDKAPTTGEPVESDYVKVPAKNTNTSGGGGSSGGGSYGITSTYTQTSKEAIEAEPREEIKCNFKDISGHWAEKSIVNMYEAGYVNGISIDSFVPDKKVTRAEFITMIVRMMGIKAEKNGYFSDVTDDAWYSESASAAFEHGIVAGSDGKLRPADIVTREEMAKIIVNVYECMLNENITESKSNFADYDTISDWAKEYVDKAYSKGLIKGTDSENFSPKSGTTRAQAAVITERLLEAVKGVAK